MIKAASEILSLIEINLKIRYRQTFLGFLWVLLNPILLYVVQLSLFTFILKKSETGYSLYLLSGLIPWFYISQTAEMGCNYINSNSNLIKNLKIHPFKLTFGLAVENFINMLCASFAICFYLFFNDSNIDITFIINYLLAGFYLVSVVSLITFISSLLNVLYKDIKYILHFLFTLLYFSTPTFFYFENISFTLQSLIKLNPFYWIISVFRLYTNAVDLNLILAVNFVILTLLFSFAIILWKTLKNRIYLKL